MRPLKVIFCDNHWDDINGKVFEQFVQSKAAEQLGFTCYYEEAPRRITLDMRIKVIAKDIQKEGDLKDRGIDVNDPEWFKNPRFKTENGEKALDHIRSYLADKTMFNFFCALKRNPIKFKGIEADEIRDLPEGLDFDPTILKLRSQLMADAYLEAKSSVFGRVGVGHLVEIQEYILEKLSRKDAEEDFLFFYIYTIPSTGEAENLEENIRLGHLKTPMRLVQINAREFKLEEVVSKVVQEIKQHRLRCNSGLSGDLPALEKEIADQYGKVSTVDFEKVLKRYYQALAAQGKCGTNLYQEAVSSYNNGLPLEAKDPSKARKFYLIGLYRALGSLKDFNGISLLNSGQKATAHSFIASCYRQLNDLPSAVSHINYALTLAQQQPDNQHSIEKIQKKRNALTVDYFQADPHRLTLPFPSNKGSSLES